MTHLYAARAGAPPAPPGAGAPVARAAGREAVLEAEVARLQARVAELEAERAHDAERRRDELDAYAATTPGWFWEMDADLRFTYFSPSVERVTGVKPEWHYGRTRAEIGMPKAVSQETWRAHLEALERREPFRGFVFQRAGPDGLRWLKTSGDPAFDAQGRFLGYRGTALDVTAEMSARQNVDRLLSAVENLNDIFVLWGPDDRLILSNARFREMNAAVAATLTPGSSFESYVRAGIRAGLFPEAAGREEDWLQERLAYHHAPGGALEVERQGGCLLLLREYRLADGCTITIATDITQRKQQAELERLAAYDDLTGLRNRRSFLEILDDELERARRYRRALSVMFIDIDRFKSVNDRHGHATGDQVLRETSAALGAHVRAMDTLARLGGEEFAVVVPESDQAQSLQMAERLRAAVERREVDADGIHLAVTVSIGVAELREGDDLEGILARADQALYAAKARGRNRVVPAAD